MRDRVGLDLEPVDVTTDEGALLLRSFVWADRVERIERLDRAIDALRATPPAIVRGDFVELLPGSSSGGVRTGSRSCSRSLLPDTSTSRAWERLGAALEAGGGQGPLAYVFAGHPEPESHQHWGLWLTTWPDGERTQLAHTDFHGTWLDWLL